MSCRVYDKERSHNMYILKSEYEKSPVTNPHQD